MKYFYLSDSKRNRLLLPDGFSVVDQEEMKKAILFGEEDKKLVLKDNNDFDIKNYSEKYLKKLAKDNIETPIVDISDLRKNNNVDSSIDDLEEHVIYSDRLKGLDEEYERIAMELDFIERSDSVDLFLDLVDLVDKFKEDGVVWGVGRGSSCACYVLYLLGVHDIDSIEFGIPFKEFSKEDLDEYV